MVRSRSQSESATGDALVADLVTRITAAVTVVEGATIYISGVPALLKAAVDLAVANGVSLDDLQPIVALQTTMDAKVEELKAALLANTPPVQPFI